MNGDESWVAGIHETAKMSSILGLPTQGSDVTILITRVHLHPLCELVEFWGKFSNERTADYESLAKDIQFPTNTFQEFEGYPGDQCLAQIAGYWYRSRIVSRNGSDYTVFLFDKGRTCHTITSQLAWGKKKNFDLPPEVEYCVLANVLPLSPGKRWSPVALEFLKSLSGRSVKAHVQDVLLAHRTFLLDIPCISKQMYEMGLAKRLSPDVFQDFVLMSLQSHSGARMSPETHTSVAAGDRLHKKELYMYPELPAGTVVTVIVTEVTNPQRIFCQLKVFSQEMKKLSEQMTQCCEGRMTSCIVGPEMIGFPCAARGSDGRWYRSVLQQVCASNKVVEVFNVDYGTKQFVQVQNVRPLASEFFRLPVVTYNCSLHGIIDKGIGWTTSQIDYLRSLLLHKIVVARFEYQSISEGVHYVTFYGDENTNINNLFGSNESKEEKTLGDYAIHTTAYNHKHPAQQESNRRKMLPHQQAVEEKEGKGLVEKLPAEDLPLNSSHVAVVQHVSDPSEFWIKTQNYANELDELMDSIYQLYKDSVNRYVVRNPTVGLYCAAKAEDGEFYRASVAEVGETQIKVFFVDYGNIEVVDKNNIWTLPDELKKLPCLSLKCTLAGVRPKDGRWNRSACDFFIKAVKDKELTVHVTAKYDKGYVVQLADPKAQGERDLGTLMCSFGLAERAETQRQPKTKMTAQSAILPQLPDARLPGVHRDKGMPFETTQNTFGPAGNERIPKFKVQLFAAGSVTDVNVSYIESPNDFWCQLVQNAGLLKLLMHNIQAHYAGSEYQPNVETACIARHPDNGMWYRAIIIHRHETPDVTVLFIDYGQTETVSLYNLRRISPEFLVLHGQAFRCSLINPVDPMSAFNEWSEEAVAKFHSFVQTAASNFGILKCTVYAVMYREKILFNIVDLETPFESVCTSMVNLAKGTPPKNAAGPSFRLDTYHYSTHNVKTGTEEQVTVTCVNNVSQFYCHLERNADVINNLKTKVTSLCHQLKSVKLPTVFGTLCFAKYTDEQWYRGQIKATKPAILVHFVDYGDTIEVEESDLLPVPREASDIMSVPVQAVVCSLSDVPADVPSEVNHWFETNATEGKFRALVVAREPDGKLLVELYHGNSQINSKIKKMFQIKMHTEEKVVLQGWRALEASGTHAQKTPKVVPKQTAEMEVHTQTVLKNVSAPKPAHQLRNGDMNLQPAPKPVRSVCENGQRVKAALLKLYVPPHQRQPCTVSLSNIGNRSDSTDAHIKPGKESLRKETERHKSKSPDTESQKESNAEIFPKLADLPPNSITSDMEADVYISHCNSPLSFYVQLVREEDAIFSLVEKLNDLQYTPQTNDIKEVRPGDLVQAEFADDSSWYRAVVREIPSKTMALVEFVDFGNTAMIPISKMGRLQKSFMQFPKYSIHCVLSEAAGLGKEEVLDPVVVSAFKKDISGVGEKVFKCQFIRQSGSAWEVCLEDSGMTVTCKVPTRCSIDGSEIASEKVKQAKEQSTQNSDIRNIQLLLNSCYHQQEFLEGHKLEVYITAVNDAQTFWCQPADSEELDKITSIVSELGEAADHKPVDPSSLFPGIPCIALFSDDDFWYRAEVIDKDGDKLSVVFVDYGNKSQVNITNVREMPRDLMESPPQAFLCELEGFDASCGSWDSGAGDELSALTTDKALQLTVTTVTREEGKIKYLVRMECEGQVINEALRPWWKGSTRENESAETLLQCHSTVTKTAPPECQLEYPEGQHVDTADACIHLQRNHSEEQSFDKLVDPHADILPCDSGIDDTMTSPLYNKGDQCILDMSFDKSAVETDKSTEEKGLSVDFTWPDDSNSPLDENPTEDTEESEMATTDSKSPGEVHTYSMESSFDMRFSDLFEERDDRKVTIARGNSCTSMTTVKMVSREAFCPREKSVDLLETRNTCEDLKQIQTELELPSCVLPVFDTPTEQETASGDGVPKEELPCVITDVESDSITGQQTLAHLEDAYSVLIADSDTAASEQQTCTAPSQDLGDKVEEATCSVEKERSCSDEEEVISLVEEEEMTYSIEEACLTDVCTALLADSDTAASEPQTCTAPSQPLGDGVEEASYSVEEEKTCSVEEEVTCSVEEEEKTCFVEEEALTCSVAGEALTCSVAEEALTCSVAEEALTCSVAEEALTCSVEEEEVTCSIEEEEVTCTVEEEEVTRSVAEEVTRSVAEEVTRSVAEEVTRSVAEDEVTRSVAEDEVTRFVAEDEVTRFVAEDEVTRSVEEELTCSVKEEELTCSIKEEALTCSIKEEALTCTVEEEALTCSVEEEALTCSVEEEEALTCSVEEEEALTCSVEEEEALTCTVAEEALTCTVAEEALTCSVAEEEVTCSVAEEEVTCSVAEEEVICSVAEEALTCSVAEEEVTCSVEEEEVTCSVEEEEEVTCSVEEEAVTCSVEEEAVTCSVEEEAVTCSVEEEAVTCSVGEEAVTCSVEEEAVTCSVEEEAVTCSVEEEEVTCSAEEEAVSCSVEEEAVSCSVEDDPNEPCVTGARDDWLSSMTAEEMVQNESLLPCREFPQILTEASSERETGDFSLQNEVMHNKKNSVSEDETSALHEDECSALPPDTEPQASTVPRTDLNELVEEVTCLVREICLTDDCRDPPQEAKGEEMEQLVHTPPGPNMEDFSDAVLENNMLSTDDSFEALLSRITHLSLIINDGSDDPEE